MKVELNYCKTPCVECPFRKTSAKGWLGGFTVEETLNCAKSEQDFLCHKSGRKGVKRQCAGRMLFASKTCKTFINESLEDVRKKVRDENSDFIENILGFDFKSYHTS